MKFPKMKLAGLATLAVVGGIGLSTVAVAAELKFANFTPPFHTVNASVIEKLNDDLSAATGGELTVKGFHGGELGAGPVEQYVRALQGVAEITWGLPSYTSSQFEKTMIAELPGVIPDDKLGYEALRAAFEDHLVDEFPGTKAIALWTSEPNSLIMRDKQVRSPDDLRGLKIRVPGKTAGDVATALGATPVQMPINELYNAMQTGLIDGVITGASVLSDFKINEVASSISMGAPLGRITFFVVLNQGAYDRLPANHKGAVDAATGAALSESAERAWRAKATQAVDAARANTAITVIDLSPSEADAFQQAVARVKDAYVAAVGGTDALAAMQGK